MMQVVLAGLGVRGFYWADVLTRSQRCEIAAYADPNPAALERAAARFGAYPAFASAEEAIDALDSVGALVLANPPIGREAQIRAALDRQIPMLIEKPLALSLDEASHLVSIAEDADVPLMVGLNFRYLPVTIETKALLAAGTVGVPEFARFTYERYRDGNRPDLNKYPLTMEHPMLWEQSIHHFDLLRYVYAQDPVTVQCHTWNPSWSMYDHDTNVSAIFTFEGGMTVNYQGTWQGNWSQPHFEWRTDCTQGVISQRDQFGDLNFSPRDAQVLTPVELPEHETWISETIGLLDAFLDTVLDGKPIQCSGRDHLMSLAMLEACITSSEEGRQARIDEFIS